jgi:hypothetical protein
MANAERADSMNIMAAKIAIPILIWSSFHCGSVRISSGPPDGEKLKKSPCRAEGEEKARFSRGLMTFVNFDSVLIIFYFGRKVNPFFQKKSQKNVPRLFCVFFAHFWTATFRTAL